jgi:putative endopeptidase
MKTGAAHPPGESLCRLWPLPDRRLLDTFNGQMNSRVHGPCFSRRNAFAVLLAFVLSGTTLPEDLAGATPADILTANRDTSVNPGDDFFQYANGAWLRKHPIPASEAAWGIGKAVTEELYAKLRQINEQAAANPGPPGSESKKIADFWTTAMNTELANRLGLVPLRSELKRIDSAQNIGDIVEVCFALRPLGVDALLSFGVSQDEKQSDVMSVHFFQGGLGLPERDFYFNTESGVARIRAEYQAHLARTLRLLGMSRGPAKTAASKVMEFETALARASRKLEDLRDPEKNYNKMSLAEFGQKHAPAILWSERLAAWELRPDYVIVGQPEFFDSLNSLLSTTPIPVLQDYLRIRLVDEYASYLSKPFEDEHFKFYRRVLSGQRKPRPRWKESLDAQEAAMGMILGQLFVKEYFPPAAKKRYADLVEAIRDAYRERINRLDWMSDATKVKAQEKLARLTVKVGYPDKWKDYSNLVVGTSSYCANMMNAARWRFNDMLSKFGKPVDRTEWEMTPQTYNAYYKPENNEIVLPAAAFAVPGMADAQLDDALVYGYAGASTIGHEITHGFDDEGRQFDARGNLTNWWTEADAAKFKERAQVMVDQFDAYEPLPGLHINGRACLGENIADHGGLLLGLDAFKKTEQYRKGETIAGLTPLQRFFLGYALGWLYQQREARLRQALLSDVHAPPKWRVLGPLANIPDFHEAYSVKTNQPMWRPPDRQAHIW